jgi:hypothetical protein
VKWLVQTSFSTNIDFANIYSGVNPITIFCL